MDLQSKMLMIGCVAMLAACDDDDKSYAKVDGLPPTIEMATAVQSEPGRKFTIEAKIKDNDGIKSINLSNADFYLDKTIDLIDLKEELVTDYALSYSYTPDKAFACDQKFTVVVTVEDVLGATTQQNITVTLDGDFTAPWFSISPSENLSVLLKNETKLKVNFTAEDDKALAKVTVSMPDFDFKKEITSFADSKKLVFSEYINMPSKIGEYSLSIVVEDKFGFTATKECNIVVSDLPDFAKMYLADVNDASKLNSDLFGVPMLVDRTGAYTYTAKYYCEKPGTEVRFIPQKTDFEPICFAPSVDDAAVLGDAPDAVNPIVLNEKGYYKITFNTKAASYTVEKYTPEAVLPTGGEPYKQSTIRDCNPLPVGKQYYLDDAQDYLSSFDLALAGSGLPGVGNWSTSDPLILTVDAENPYLFRSPVVELTAGSEMEFTITPRHDWGWWPEPFFRFESGSEDSGENEYNTRNGGNNMKKVTVQADGKYQFIFDTHLMRSKFILVD